MLREKQDDCCVREEMLRESFGARSLLFSTKSL